MFTSEQIKEIAKKLQALGIKDSQFTDATNLSGKETFTLIQDGTNKKINIKNFSKYLSDYITEGTVETIDYNALKNKPSINNVSLKGKLTLEDLGIIIPDVSNYVTEQEVISHIASQQFKTINNEDIRGEGNIAIKTQTLEVDNILNISSGNPISNKAVAEAVAKLNQKVFPLTLSSSGGSVYEKGTTQTITIRWTIKEGDSIVVPDSITINDEVVDKALTSKQYSNVSSDTTYTIKISKGGITKTSTVVVRFVNATYYGSVENSFVPSENAIKALTKKVLGTKSYTAEFNLDNKKSLYAYPKSFGALVSIKDSNNFDYINSYNRTELTINNETYYVYILKDPTTITNFKQIYT